VVVNGVWNLVPNSYVHHALHGSEAEWAETNCYVDLWIGLLHGLGLEPHACLSMTLCADFEDDQWTFFKPYHSDLRVLYGLQVEELSLWRPVLDHCVEHVRQRRVPLLEADSFFLPDTRATDYHVNHVKTTIAPVFVDPERKLLRYFHNAGFYEVEGADFDGLFRFEHRKGTEQELSNGIAHWLPPYCEIVKTDRAERLPAAELTSRSSALLSQHFAWRPSKNPFERFAEQWPAHQQQLLERDLETYHGYTFSMLRQCGACYSLLAAHLRWQEAQSARGFSQAAESFAQISQICKAMLMKLARVVNSKKPRDFSDQLTEMARHWQEGVSRLGERLG
jgi:hypothetical protein